MATRSTTTKDSAELPLLGERRLDREHLDRIQGWLARSPRAAECRALQADLLAWSPAQRGLAAAQGLEGLWRTTRVVRTSGELALEDPDYDDIEAIEAADAPDLDGQSTWSDERERLFYFLEIRGRAFRELDASVYPIVSEVYEFDADELNYVAGEESRNFVAAAIYKDWSWAICSRDDGFAEILGAEPVSRGRRLPPKWRAGASELLLNYHNEDGILIDRLRRTSADVLERRVFLFAEGLYTFSIRCTYERFAAPLVGPEERAATPSIELAVAGPTKAAKKVAKKPAVKATKKVAKKAAKKPATRAVKKPARSG